jgi:CRP-like cAMP-binding protein
MEHVHQQLLEFFSQSKLRTYRKHDLILHEDDVPNGVYLIKSGYLRLYSISPDGEELTRLVLGPQDVFPIRWTFTQEPIDYYAEPMTELQAWYISRQSFVDFLHDNPDVFSAVVQMMAHRMGTLYKRMEYLSFGDAYQKVTTILVDLAARFGTTVEDGVKIELPLTQKELGSFIGLVRETVGMEIERLKSSQLIEFKDHHIVIKDLKKLTAESQR